MLGSVTIIQKDKVNKVYAKLVFLTENIHHERENSVSPGSCKENNLNCPLKMKTVPTNICCI